MVSYNTIVFHYFEKVCFYKIKICTSRFWSPRPSGKKYNYLPETEVSSIAALVLMSVEEWH